MAQPWAWGACGEPGAGPWGPGQRPAPVVTPQQTTLSL